MTTSLKPASIILSLALCALAAADKPVHPDKAAKEAAFAKARAGDAEGAKAGFESINPHPKNTSQWHAANGSMTLRAAVEQRDAGLEKQAQKSAKDALKDLEKAAADAAAEPEFRSYCLSRIGFIQSEFLGDKEAAKAKLREALALKPADAANQTILAKLESGSPESLRKRE